MNVSFGPGSTPVSNPAAPENQTQALASVQSPGVPATSGGLILGDKIPDFSEIILPRVNLAQNIGKLKDTFPPGSLVLGQQVLLFCPPDVDVATGNVRRAATPPVTLTVLGFRPTRFCEKVAGGARGLIVNTEDAVRANGGTLDYKEWKLKESSGMKRFEPLADALVLVERPESSKDDDTVFIFPANGKKYAIALWGLRGVAYTAAAKRVFFTQRSLGTLRGGYPTYSFYTSSRTEGDKGKEYWVPVCTVREKNTEEFLTLVRSILGGSITPPSAPPEAAAGE